MVDCASKLQAWGCGVCFSIFSWFTRLFVAELEVVAFAVSFWPPFYLCPFYFFIFLFLFFSRCCTLTLDALACSPWDRTVPEPKPSQCQSQILARISLHWHSIIPFLSISPSQLAADVNYELLGCGVYRGWMTLIPAGSNSHFPLTFSFFFFS